MGPLPSIGSPSAFTTRPTSASPTGTCAMRLVRLTMSPSLMSLSSPRSTAPTGQRRPRGLAERHRGADPRAHAAGRVVLELAVRGGDRLQMVDAALRRDQREKITGERGHLEPRGDLAGGGALRRGRDPWAREEGAELGVAPEQLADG